jgi:hypothetical protein
LGDFQHFGRFSTYSSGHPAGEAWPPGLEGDAEQPEPEEAGIDFTKLHFGPKTFSDKFTSENFGQSLPQKQTIDLSLTEYYEQQSWN